MFKNRTIIKIKGLNQERALNNITRQVKIYNYKREEHSLSQFEVDFKDRTKIKKLITEQGLELLSITHKGLIYYLKNIFLRYGIVAGIILTLAFYILQYNFVYKVEVWGVSKEESQEVKIFVEDNMTSNMKSRISTNDLEILVRSNFDFVSSVSIAIVGQSLIVNLNQSVLPEEIEGNYQPIVSKYDGLITKINLIQGTLNVNEGDIVQKGDILVLPYTTDSDGTVYEVNPKAEIIADVWLSTSITHYDYRVEKIRTGKSTTKVEVLLNNLLIYDNNVDIAYKNYEIECYTEELTKNLILPFKIKKTIFYEIEIIEIAQPFEDVKDAIIEEARQKTLIFLEENDIILNEGYTLDEGGGCHIINYTITLSKNIGGEH